MDPNNPHKHKDFQAMLDAMFVPKNQELWDKLWERMQDEEKLENLAKATGIQDQELIARLLKLGVTSENLAAMALYPLLLVAWADGVLHREEREVIMQSAAEWNVIPGHPSYDLLQNWLHDAPDPENIEIWKAYVRTVTAEMDAAEKEKLKEEVLRRAKDVANAFGELASFGEEKTSRKERQCINELEMAFI